ncbi:IS607 family transposase [Crocosphaera chwakensis]|uniref:HTH merR-type domain-containing protein n=1 Tax=Crocosphaera chwakensis CCY0110 TaxID=391612 RepID=A3ITN8_9CHRO|nr:IS607 family transposase [Crocosphaera chwakensis]EAZ90104.1 hypothetical protein CY0110_05874 [Crocosphaera chwakensis CCY0110]
MTYLLTIKEAAKFLGVSPKTLRRWENAGKIKAYRTQGGHRRFKVEELYQTVNTNLLTVCYCRISNDQSLDDLEKQVNCLESYCQYHGWSYEIIKDIGSGVNYKNQGLIRLLKLICNQEVERLILTQKDKLLRLGDDLFFTVCEFFEIEVIIINCSKTESMEDDLTEDFQEIVNQLKDRLYGLNNPTNAKLLEEVEKITLKYK